MNIFVVILHFGSITVTKNCIESLKKNDTFPKTIVVVNNTPDAIAEILSKNVLVINNKKNLGFAKGVNKGIAYALKHKATHVLLLNNDTLIAKPIMKSLITSLDSVNGIAGPSIRFIKNKKIVFDIGGKINTIFFRTSHKEVEKITNRLIREVAYVSGCCMMIKKEVFKKIGLFDESFFLYYEDADFCLRAKKAGFTTVLVPSVIIDHTLSASKGKVSSFTIYYLLKSGVSFGKKYAKTPVQIFANRLFLLFQALLFIKANPKASVSVIRALLS